MFHYLRFAAGVVTGVVLMQLLKSKKTKASLEKAEDTLRDAAASTLETVEKASARARARLHPEQTAKSTSKKAKKAAGGEEQA